LDKRVLFENYRKDERGRPCQRTDGKTPGIFLPRSPTPNAVPARRPPPIQDREKGLLYTANEMVTRGIKINKIERFLPFVIFFYRNIIVNF
jgi:hypothetical protein